MILNKEKKNLIKSNKDYDGNQKKNIYLRNIILRTNSKYKSNVNSQIKNINENMKSISSSDESKKKNLKFVPKQNKKERSDIMNNRLTLKAIDNVNYNNNYVPITYTEPENNIIEYKDSKDKKYKKKISNVKNNLFNNLNEKVIVLNNNSNNSNKNNKIEYKKIEYNNIKNNNEEYGYKTPVTSGKKYSDEEKDNLSIENLKQNDIYINNYSNYNNMYNSINYQLNNTLGNNTIDFSNINTIDNNSNEYILDNNIYKNKRKTNIQKLSKIRKNSVSLITNKFPNKTANSFYTHKKPINDEINNQLINNHPGNILSDYNDIQIITYPDNIENLNDYNYRTLDNNFKRNIINRRKNKIRIIDNGRSIKEFNISFPDEENDYYFGKNKNNYRTINNNLTKKKSLIEIYKTNNNIQDIPPIKINHLYTIVNNNNNINNNNEKMIFKNKRHFASEYFTERNKKIYNNRKIISSEYLDNNNTNPDIENNNIINNDISKTINNTLTKTNTFKILIKKRPKHDMKIKNFSHKKFQNVKFLKDIDKKNIYKEINEDKYNKINNIKIILSNSKIQNEELIENNKNEFDNKNRFEFYPAQRLSIIAKPKINDIIDKEIEDINQNKNIFIIKKDKGKIINRINIDEDIEKINQQLLNDKFTVNNIPIKLIPLNNDILDNKNKIINEENVKLKKDTESLTKNDMMKEELIKNFIKEKQNLNEQINNLMKENNEQKNTIEQLLKENEKLKEDNIKINNSLNELLKAQKAEEEMFDLGNLEELNFNVDIESINDGQTEKLDEIKEIKDLMIKKEKEKENNKI